MCHGTTVSRSRYFPFSSFLYLLPHFDALQAEIIISSDSDEAPIHEEISDSEPEQGVRPKRKRRTKAVASTARVCVVNI